MAHRCWWSLLVFMAMTTGIAHGLVSDTEERVVSNVTLHPSGSEAQGEMHSFFDSLIRTRRQLKARKDEQKQGFTEIEKQAMLTILNSHRSLVSPTAADMIELRWDNDIEDFAQDWANNCKPAHRSGRDLKEWINMGETIHWKNNAYLESAAVKFWWREKKWYTFQDMTCEAGKACGHYVTAAWAKSEYVGCGIKHCANLLPVFNDKIYLIVCDYSGRFFSKTKPYVAGPSCSSCPDKYPKCRYNLCVTQSMLNNCQGYNGTTIYLTEPRDNTKSDPFNCQSGPSTAKPTTKKPTTKKPTTKKPTTKKPTTKKPTTKKPTTKKPTTKKPTTKKPTTKKPTTKKPTTKKPTTKKPTTKKPTTKKPTTKKPTTKKPTTKKPTTKKPTTKKPTTKKPTTKKPTTKKPTTKKPTTKKPTTKKPTTKKPTTKKPTTKKPTTKKPARSSQFDGASSIVVSLLSFAICLSLHVVCFLYV